MRYNVFHSYKPTIIVPYIGIEDNWNFITRTNEEKEVITADNITCKVVSYKEKHICTLEKDIREIYNCDVFSWLKKWYAMSNKMDSLHVFVLELEKI